MILLKNSKDDRKTWYDNPDLFQNKLVADDGQNQWYFTVWAEDSSQQPAIVRYGLTDEAGKVNLNMLTSEDLLKLPNMTAELADCLLDFIDADSEPRPQGAEQDFYSRMESPYQIPNGPLATLDELLLVKGFSARIVYGEDANLNGLLDPNEDDGDDSFPPDNRDGLLDRGLHGVATVFSVEPNVDSTGQPRTNLNGLTSSTRSGGRGGGGGTGSGSGTDTGGSSTATGLPQKTLDFISAYLGEGNKFKHPSELLEMKYTLKQTVPNQPEMRAGMEIDSGVGAAELAILLDKYTTGPTAAGATVRGLVNVNSAPHDVLAVLPGIDGGTAQRITDMRGGADAETLATPAWLYAQGVLDATAFKAVAPRLTARSYQFSIRCIGFGVPKEASAAQAGRFRVIEAVVDLTSGTPRIIYLRDITRLGLPFPVNVDSIERGSPS
jgi:hypothetical protein